VAFVPHVERNGSGQHPHFLAQTVRRSSSREEHGSSALRDRLGKVGDTARIPRVTFALQRAYPQGSRTQYETAILSHHHHPLEVPADISDGRSFLRHSSCDPLEARRRAWTGGPPRSEAPDHRIDSPVDLVVRLPKQRPRRGT